MACLLPLAQAGVCAEVCDWITLLPSHRVLINYHPWTEDPGSLTLSQLPLCFLSCLVADCGMCSHAHLFFLDYFPATVQDVLAPLFITLVLHADPGMHLHKWILKYITPHPPLRRCFVAVACILLFVRSLVQVRG